MTRALALIALLGLPHFGQPADVHHGHKRIGVWSLNVAQARFSHEVSCKLTAPGVAYERQALVIRLSRAADTTDAVYRVDAGAPTPVRGDALELARLGFQLYDDDLANPSGGLVRIPARLLAGAQQVSVQAKPGGSVAKFKVAGLTQALQAARAAGCAEDSFR